jgi:fructose-1,6-bisphosphatase/inositol monophosphatase family enzyme
MTRWLPGWLLVVQGFDQVAPAPDDEIYGEEGGTIAGTSGRRWIIDPIDGTLYFANRIPLFANLVAYEDEHGPAIGVINNPITRQVVFAGRGLGCWIRAGHNPDVRPVLRDNAELRQAVTELSNPATWHSELLSLVAGLPHGPSGHMAEGRWVPFTSQAPSAAEAGSGTARRSGQMS